MDPVEAFEQHLVSLTTTVPPGTFSMWWATEAEPSFTHSPIRSVIKSAYDAADGMETVLYPMILNKFQLITEEGRVTLPEESNHLFVQGKEEATFIISISAEKGIRLHFSEQEASPAYRDECWATFRDYAVFWRDVLRKQGLINQDGTFEWEQKPRKGLLSRLRREQELPRPIGWWKLTEAVCLRYEAAGEQVKRAGSVVCG